MTKIQPLTSDRTREALDFVCHHFITGSNLHSVFDISQHDYKTYLTPIFFRQVDEGISFISIDEESDSINGCILANDITARYPEASFLPEGVSIIKLLLSMLENLYFAQRNVEKGSTLLVDLAVVSPKARRQGLYTTLRDAVHHNAREKGYIRVVGELTSAATQHLCISKLHHRVVCEIPFKDFEFEGYFPFSCIDKPKSIQLVEGVL